MTLLSFVTWAFGANAVMAISMSRLTDESCSSGSSLESYINPEYSSLFLVGIPYIGKMPASARSWAASSAAIFSLFIAASILSYSWLASWAHVTRSPLNLGDNVLLISVIRPVLSGDVSHSFMKSLWSFHSYL